MSLLLESAFLLVLSLPAFFVAYQLILAFASLFQPLKRDRLSDEPSTCFVVIIPAHNEELLVSACVKSVFATGYPEHLVRVLVVADNCSDQTAGRAKAAGADCIERDSPEKRGKPYALAFAIDSIANTEFDAVVVLDADTTLDIEFLRQMDREIRSGVEVAQGYFDVSNPNDSWLTRLSVLPAVLRFRMQYPGKVRLGLSCPLAGNGMCFSKRVIETYGWQAFSLTENWEYWAQLCVEGVRTYSVPEARIYSQDTKSLSAGASQRERWTRGRSDVARLYTTELFRSVRRTGNSPMKIDAVIELVRPSHATLTMVSVVLFATALLLSIPYPSMVDIVLIASIVLGGQILFLLSGMFVMRAPLKTWLALAMLPVYLSWRSFVSIKALLRSSAKEWVRTERH